MKPLFSYYGTKGKLAELYPAPRHDHIIEAFAGAAGYALRFPDLEVDLYDLDDYVTDTWRWLIAASGEDVAALPVGDVGDVRLLNIPRGAQNLIGYWLNPASAAPKRHASQRSGWNSRRRDLIADGVEQINHWRVHQRSFLMIPNACATWFVDPPYQTAGKYYRHSAAAISYTQLAEWVVGRWGQVIVCENAGADWLPFTYLSDLQGMIKKSTEVIWES